MNALAAVLLLALAQPPGASGNFAVLPPRVPTGAQALATTLAQTVAQQVARRVPAGTRVVSADDLGLMLGQARERALAGCDEGACVAELSGALDAAELIATSATRVDSGLTGESWVVEVKRVDAKSGARLSGGLVSLCGGANEVAGAAALATAEAFGDRVTGTTSGRCASSRGVLGAAGGAVLMVAGAGLLVPGLTTKAAYDTQQGPGTVPTVTRAEAAVAQRFLVGGLVVAGVGVAVTAASVALLQVRPAEPRVALTPLPGGAAVVLGGSF